MVKYVLREIKNSLGRYLAILAIIALGVGFFSGLRVTRTSMVKTVDSYLDELNTYDFRFVSTLGFTQKNVDAVCENDSVAQAEGAISADALVGGGTVYSFLSIQDTVNKPSLEAGRMPESPGECLADRLAYSEADIGSVIELDPENDEDTFDKFAVTEFTIVGLASSPLYLNFERGSTSLGNGSVSCFIYIPKCDFACDYFTDIYVASVASGTLFSDEYNEGIEALTSDMEALCQEQADARYDALIDDANEKLDDANEEFQNGISQYVIEKTDAQRSLDEAWRELSDAKRQISDGQAKLDDGYKQLEASNAEATAEIDKSEAQLENAKKTLDEGEAAYASNASEYEAALAQYTAAVQAYGESFPGGAEMKAQLDASKTQLDAVHKQLDSANAQYLAGVEQLEASKEQLNEQLAQGMAELRSAKAELDSAKAQYNSGVTEYYDAKAEAEQKFSDAEAELLSAKNDIADAEQEVADIETPSTFTLTRDSNTGIACFESDSQIVLAVSTVFPLFFLLVAALICITTMTRMVEDDRTQIGVFKALGFSERSIALKYMLYSGSASLLGCFAGFIGGSYLFPKMLWQAYNIMYHISRPLCFVLDWSLAAISILAYMVCALGSTWYVCHSTMSEVPASLIRPKSPKSGKRVLLERLPLLWNRLGFMAKVSIRNIFRYKQRFFMMVLGIGGCTALLLTGFGLNDSISGIIDYQYDEIDVYDGSVNFAHELSDKEAAKLSDTCGDMLSGITYMHSSTMDAAYGGITKSARFNVADGAPSGLVNMTSADGAAVAWPQAGSCIISIGLSESLGAKVGDAITLTGSDFSTLSLTVSGVYTNYVYNYVWVDSSTCLAQWGSVPEYKTALVSAAEGVDSGALSASLMGLNFVTNASMNHDMRVRLDRTLENMNYIVYLIIVCAAALAFIVLYNLTNININERLREIATIKVLGFYPAETAMYVFRENFILTLIGAVVGLPLGKLLHAFVMTRIKIDLVHFDVRVAWLSILYSIVLTLVFSFAVDLVMQVRLKRINMSESLKSIE